MLFAIDIDHTIAGGFKAYIEHHNRDLSLGISQTVLDRLENYQYTPTIADILRERLIIVAFGVDPCSLPQRDDVNLLALPSWYHVTDLVTTLSFTLNQGEKR